MKEKYFAFRNFQCIFYENYEKYMFFIWRHDMNSQTFPVLGFDIGGTKIACCLAMSDGTILASARVDNRDRAPSAVLPEIAAAGRKLLTEAHIDPASLRAIGIGSPSPLDFEKGIIQAPHNMPLWVDVPIRDFLSREFGVPAFFDNDANAAGAAEWIFGAGRGVNDMIYLTMSTGIGGGIIASGRMVRGRTNYAGEVGHIVIDRNGPVCNCGQRGDYEAFCGGKAIAQRLRKELADKKDSAIVKAAGGRVEDIDMRALETAVRAKDPFACSVWDEMIERNAQAMGILINIFNPSIVALGTIAVKCGALFMDPLLARLPHYCWPQMFSVCRVVPSELGGAAGELSGVSVALYSLYERGEWALPWQAE